MTSRERVHAALKKEPVDRVPVFMWFHPETTKKLAAMLEVPVARMAEAMGNDVVQTWVNNNFAMEAIVHEHEGEGHVDYWGLRWVKRDAFNQIAEFPLAGAGVLYRDDEYGAVYWSGRAKTNTVIVAKLRDPEGASNAREVRRIRAAGGFGWERLVFGVG